METGQCHPAVSDVVETGECLPAVSDAMETGECLPAVGDAAVSVSAAPGYAAAVTAQFRPLQPPPLSSDETITERTAAAIPPQLRPTVGHGTWPMARAVIGCTCAPVQLLFSAGAAYGACRSGERRHWEMMKRRGSGAPGRTDAPQRHSPDEK